MGAAAPPRFLALAPAVAAANERRGVAVQRRRIHTPMSAMTTAEDGALGCGWTSTHHNGRHCRCFERPSPRFLLALRGHCRDFFLALSGHRRDFSWAALAPSPPTVQPQCRGGPEGVLHDNLSRSTCRLHAPTRSGLHTVVLPPVRLDADVSAACSWPRGPRLAMVSSATSSRSCRLTRGCVISGRLPCARGHTPFYCAPVGSEGATSRAADWVAGPDA